MLLGYLRRQQGNGFTLISLLAVLVIMAIMFGVGLPALWEIYQQTKLKQAAREVLTAMRASRYRAINESGTFGVLMRQTSKATVALNPDEVVLFIGDNPADAANQYRTIDLPSGIFISSPPSAGAANSFPAGGGGHFVVFTADGSASDDGFVRLGKANAAADTDYFVEVNLDPPTTARMRLRSWDPAAGTWKENG